MQPAEPQTDAGPAVQVFDGHNDVLLRLWQSERAGGDPVAAFLDGEQSGHIDLPRARAGGLAGGLCAVFVPSGEYALAVPDAAGRYQTPIAAPVPRDAARRACDEIVALALRLEAAGAWTLCRSTAAIRAAMAAGRFAAVLHIEGAEAIGPEDLDGLEALHALGLRSLGPVWSRPNAFGHGVPFAWPASPDCAPGLTGPGRALVRECDRLGIALDLSHLSEKGFDDVAALSDRPLIASHSNAHALTAVARNLTDRQLAVIGETKGIVGLNFACTMLRADGQENAATPLSDMVRHVDHMVALAGIDCVGLGSDFDGATIPEGIGDAAGTQALVGALRAAGYGEAELRLLCRENWLRVLGAAWREDATEDFNMDNREPTA